MFGLSALELARLQFGFTVCFHIIFPAMTIGLASYLAVLEGLWLWKKERVYLNLHHFWAGGNSSNGNASSTQYLLMIGATLVSMNERTSFRVGSSFAANVSVIS
jgi:hypothetical protein